MNNINKQINFYKVKAMNNDQMNNSEEQDLNHLLKKLIEYYDKGEPLISDEEYDILHEYLIYNGAPRIISDTTTNYGVRIKHPTTKLRGTLSKIYYLNDNESRINKSRKTLSEWIKSKPIDLTYEKVHVCCKYDGLSCVGYFKQGRPTLWLTRGDTDSNEGLDISHIMNHIDIKKLNPEGYTNCAIQYEIMISNNDLELLNHMNGTSYKNTRSIVASILNSKEIDKRIEYLHPVPLKLLYNNAEIPIIHPRQLKEYPNIECSIDETNKIARFANEHRIWNGLRMDGCVLTLSDINKCIRLGRKDNINEYEVAYKFTEEYGYAKVHNIIFDVSFLGVITPVVEIVPIQLKGNTITNISISNKDRFDELDLHYNDIVKISYDIIPYLSLDNYCNKLNINTHKDTRFKIKFIDKCPICNEPLNLKNTLIRCMNPKCNSNKMGRIIIFLQRLDCKDIGPATIEILFNSGIIKSIPDLFHIGSTKQYKLIMGQDGFGEIKTKKLLACINKIKKLEDYKFFGAIGIYGLSEQFFKLLFKNMEYNNFIECINNKDWKYLENTLISIKGIGHEKIRMLIQGLKNDKKLILNCLKYITITPSYGFVQGENGGVCFTGFRDKQMEQDYINKGYFIQDNITNDTVLLITKDINSGSSKIRKAINKNIKIIEI